MPTATQDRKTPRKIELSKETLKMLASPEDQLGAGQLSGIPCGPATFTCGACGSSPCPQ